ncbi:MAG: hypothetical protein IKL99_02905 [Oscillospiraceae bacterium]|nr:hypothetical protein [Oscillospiraceae bacterium]
MDICLARSGYKSGTLTLRKMIPGTDRSGDHFQYERGSALGHRAAEGKRRKRCRWQKKRAAFEAAAVIAVFGESRNHLCRNGEQQEWEETKKRDRRSGLFEVLIEISAWRTGERGGRPRSVKKTCRRHVFSGGRSGYAARRGTSKAAERRGKRKDRRPNRGEVFVKADCKISAWRTEEHDERPSDRTFEGCKPESLAAQSLYAFENSLTSNLTPQT